MNLHILKSKLTYIFVVLGISVSVSCAQDRKGVDEQYLKNFLTIYNYVQQFYVEEANESDKYLLKRNDGISWRSIYCIS